MRSIEEQSSICGQKFGKLTPVRIATDEEAENFGHVRGKQVWWWCECECGNTVLIRAVELLSGQRTHCGCKTNCHKYGENCPSGTRIFNTWRNMIWRCYSEKCKAYKHYGGRGIKVCDEWLDAQGFLRFREWAFNNGYAENYTIDRIDVNKGYSPDNCRWITQAEQTRNTRKTIRLTIDGETKTIDEWCAFYDVSKRGVYYRYRKHMDAKDIFAEMVNKKNRKQ